MISQLVGVLFFLVVVYFGLCYATSFIPRRYNIKYRFRE